jgi:hypothetical protein
MQSPSIISTDSFSIIKRGLFYKLVSGIGVIKNDPYLWSAIFFVMITWIPMLLLSFWDGLAMGSAVRIPFLHDFTIYSRFLVTLPLLILSDGIADPRLRSALRQLETLGLVAGDDREPFFALLRKMERYTDAAVTELIILAAVIAHAYFALRGGEWIDASVSNWYVRPHSAGLGLTLAGWWLGFSIAILQFFIYRWLWRMIVWAWFLWRVSKLGLRLMPAHPDRMGGLSFIGRTQGQFKYVLFAISSMASGYCANRIAFGGDTLQNMRLLIGTYLALVAGIFLCPILFLLPTLREVRRKGLADYGALAAEYVRSFDQKWIRGKHPENEPLLGNPDIQSLADIQNSYGVVRSMTVFPINKRIAMTIAGSAVAPFLPLLLTVIPASELLKRILKMVFG